ncbi:glycosyltransferase family 2 protein [Candidatus Pacearchaeota archaeon]|nr:glycosyltransferase family 2 protein [Candidatus Pacearchaeota archaeon]
MENKFLIKDPKIGILLLNLNGSKDTIECLKSIKEINYKNYEIWVLDNGSGDDSVKKLRELKKKVKFNLLTLKENKGFTGGNNYLFNKIRKEGLDYLLLLNNDTIVEKNFLNPLMEKMGKNDNVGVVAPLVYNYYNKARLSFVDSPGKFNLLMGCGRRTRIHKENDFQVDYASGVCWLIKKDLFEKMGGFNDKFFAYGEEIELAFRIKKAGFKTFIIPSSRIWHKGAATSKKISGLRRYLENRNTIWFEKKYGGFYYYPFLLYFMLYKTPKNILKISLNKNRYENLKAFLRGVRDGLSQGI